jgi:hypothetical protein
MNMFNLIPTMAELELGDCGSGCRGCYGCDGCKGERATKPVPLPEEQQ